MMLHITPAGHVLTIRTGRAAGVAVWFVYEERDGALVLIGSGKAAINEETDATVIRGARQFCWRYDATEAIVLESMMSSNESLGNLTGEALLKRYAALLAIFP